MATTENLVKRFAEFGIKIKVYEFEMSTHTVELAADVTKEPDKNTPSKG